MPYSWNRPPVPIDKSKQGGRSFDSSTYTDFTKIGTIAQVNATKSTGTNNKNLYSNLDEKRRAELLISGLQTIPRALCPTCPTFSSMPIILPVSALLANLYAPYQIVIGSSGNIFITDSYNSRICKINPIAGTLLRVAGTGTSGFSGDNGFATLATLGQPQGLAVDTSENIYIADFLNCRIRKVDVNTGIITTIAGTGTAGFSGDNGPAISASMGAPWAIVIDSSGNVYIVDTTNNRVRKITASTGIITTIAGNGTAGYSGDTGLATSAQLNNPTGLAIDSSGNVYIADASNNRVRKITVSTGIITTIAGTGTAGYSGDTGLATSAQLNNPTGLAIDSSGNVYIADTYNNRVRKITVSTGIITTIAGTGTAGYSGDTGLATSATLKGPNGVSVNSSGDVYIADTTNNRVRKITASTGIITTIAA